MTKDWAIPTQARYCCILYLSYYGPQSRKWLQTVFTNVSKIMTFLASGPIRTLTLMQYKRIPAGCCCSRCKGHHGNIAKAGSLACHLPQCQLQSTDTHRSLELSWFRWSWLWWWLRWCVCTAQSLPAILFTWQRRTIKKIVKSKSMQWENRDNFWKTFRHLRNH